MIQPVESPENTTTTTVEQEETLAAPTTFKEEQDNSTTTSKEQDEEISQQGEDQGESCKTSMHVRMPRPISWASPGGIAPSELINGINLIKECTREESRPTGEQDQEGISKRAE